MFTCRFCLFYLVTVSCIYLCVGSYHPKKCAETEKQALLKLKDGFIYGRDILSSWNGDDCCKWKGISCNNLTGRVTKLDLRFSNFTPVVGAEDLKDLPGTLTFAIYNDPAFVALGGKVDSSICELQHLTFLDLSENELEGEIPKCIGSLDQLIELKLARNELVGFIPYTLANLSNLQNLDLSYNYDLVANDLEWLSHLSNLKYLALSNINLSRAIDWPSSINKIPYLVELYLNYCELPQVNPKSISHMNSSTTLRILCLSGNELNSSILLWVVNVSKVLTVLDLSDNSLHNVSIDFAHMISLQYLDLSLNELDGSIIKSFHTLCQVKGLYLHLNKLSGQLSDYIQELCSTHDLEWLSLNDNPFIGGPLPNFSRFSSLKTLFLGNTNIVGPLSFDHLPHLEILDLSHNQLSGTLPNTLGQFSNLTALYLSSNKFNDIITEAHLVNLSKLEILHLSENSLSFTLNPNWVPPFQLQDFHASSCILGPQFPMWLKYQRKLEMLQLSNTSITDSFPKWFWDISSSLLYLNVSHNKLSGVLPKSLSSLTAEYTSTWDLSFNNLSGPLPRFPPQIYGLLLSNNMFSTFVSSFCETLPMYLMSLDLSSNLLAGSLPDCWENFQSLEVLNLAKNSLSGRIPKSFGTLQQIESMHLNDNNFSGEIPSLTLCKSLKFIDFGNNILEGTLPTWIGHNLLDLIVLQLRGNKIHGNIPKSLCNLLSVQVLDLSSNNITGEIPQCLSKITALSNTKFPRKKILINKFGYNTAYGDLNAFYVDKAVLAWKGENREYGKILGLVTIMDLSSNHLTGEIPKSITTLKALLALNLSGNNLTGFIPNNIGHMERLESLDLSRNHLYGRMPASFANLSFLSYMNLSFNNLSGEIPVSTQLRTFDASTYIGNIGLCGPPLTNQCPGDVPPIGVVDRNNTNEDKEELITIGFYICFGLGFCVGFWGVCGTLTIKSSWRHTYFRFFNNISDWIYVTVVVFTTKFKRRIEESLMQKNVGSSNGS